MNQEAPLHATCVSQHPSKLSVRRPRYKQWPCAVFLADARARNSMGYDWFGDTSVP